MIYESWNSISWIDVSNKVLNLQSKIFEASKYGNLHMVHVYQNTIINMYESKLLSIRKVTQNNRGKRTGGIDGVKILNASDRLKLTSTLKIDMENLVKLKESSLINLERKKRDLLAFRPLRIVLNNNWSN